MKRSSDPLPRELADALVVARERLTPLAGRVLFFNSIESTSDVAVLLAAEPDAEGAVVIADAQTAGRGRLGRRWHSPPACGLYVSVVLRGPLESGGPGRATSLLTLMAGVALAEAIEASTGLQPDIKWPNDLHVARRKLGGVLAEAVGVGREVGRDGGARDAIVLGYGINVGTRVQPPELRDRATSLEDESGRSIDRWALCVETLASLSRRYRDLSSGRFDAILDAWRSRAPASRGAPVAWTTPGGVVRGVTVGVDERGALLVRVGDRVERIVGGEINWE